MRVKNPGIRLVLYSAEGSTDSQVVSRAVSRLFPPAQILRCQSCRGVAEALRGVLSGYGIVLMMIRGEAELTLMSGLGDRLRDHAVILILDNSSADLTRQALRLYPRYTGSVQDGVDEILMVLEKMIAKIETTFKGEDNG